MLCRFEFTAFLLCRLSPEFVAVLSFSGGGTNVGCMEVADSAESVQGSPDFFSKYWKQTGWFICLHWSPDGGGDTFVFMLRIQLTLFHFTSYGCQIKPSFFHTSCNQYQSLSYFKSRSHALRKSIKVVCTKITIVTVTFCVQSFFWYLSKQAPFCDEWCPDSVFFGKQNKSISWYIYSFLWRLTKKDVFPTFYQSYKTYQKKKVTCQSNSGVLCF